ncbi:MAG: PrgI family protein [bacterium]|nr:PrgI family protein [bacterium]
MQFQVPQFIEVEDKIFGPLTLRQFLYLGGGVGISVVLYFLIPIKFLAILLAIPFVALALALAFYKINNKPFVFTLEAAFSYALKNKLYIWKKIPKKPQPKEVSEENLSIDQLISPRLSDSKLKDLAWSLDVNEKLGSGESKKVDARPLVFEEEEKDRVEFQKNYDIGAKGHT